LNTKLLLEGSTPFCLAESWARDLTILTDRPLSAAIWNLGEMTGEQMLDELPELQVDRQKLVANYN
jgi:hypothetical protein